MSLSHLTNNRLIERVRSSKFTNTELELAERLSEAIRELDILTEDIRKLQLQAAVQE